jgi:CubicO group peptidase (beta-lactamase class C family)
MRFRIFAVAAICSLAVQPAAAATADPAARMQQIVQTFVADKSFMGTVLVVKDGKPILDKGYGSADLEWGVANKPAVKFRLGSLTKQFTAASILLLQERGKLNVTDPISKYLTDAPPAWQNITIYNVLTHTSGIPNFTDGPDYDTTQWKAASPAELVARFRDKPLDFAPGTNFRYSNSGYVLLGYLIEKVSGQTYERFLRENIFTPLAMTSTGVDTTRAILPGRAQGYESSPNGFVHTTYIDMTIPFSAGDLYSTTGDLLKWERGLFGGKVVNAASLKAMTTPFKSNYAFGLIVQTKDGHKVITHTGGVNGFATSLSYFPDDKLVVIVLGNVINESPSVIADTLGKVALGQPVTLMSERKEVPVSAQRLGEYVGVYKVAGQGNFIIGMRDGHLTSQLGLQPEFPMFAESDSKFFLKVVDAQIGFFRDPATHAVNRLVLYQNGSEVAAPKLVTRPIVAAAPSVLADYTGNYAMATSVSFPATGATAPRPAQTSVISVKDGRLVMKFGEAPATALDAESDTMFFFKEIDGHVEFFRDPTTHAVTHLVFHQDGHDREGKKLP